MRVLASVERWAKFWTVRPAPELRMGLRRNEEGMLGELHELDQTVIGRSARAHQASLLEARAVAVVGLEQVEVDPAPRHDVLAFEVQLRVRALPEPASLIAVRADLTRPAINHYFSSKRVLYREVVERTNELVVTAGIDRARAETTLLGRMAAFIAVAQEVDTQNPSTAAFLATAVLESQRHPELSHDDHDSLAASREFMSWAVNDAIKRGELTTDTDIKHLVEMLVAVMWGMGFYAGFVGKPEDLGSVVHKFELLMANKLWHLHE